MGPAVNTFDPKDLIAEVARRHQVLLAPGDPIFVTVTLNEAIVARAVERVAGLLDAAADQMSAATAQQREASKEEAAALVTGAAVYLVQQAEKAADELATRLRQEVGAEVARLHAVADRAERATRVAVCAAAASATGIAGIVLALVASSLATR